MSRTIAAEQLETIDPSDIRVFEFDWDADNLPAAVTIATSTFTITAIQQADVGASLTKDNPSILTGSRKTQVRLNATTASLGDRYELANKIVTNESPPQTKERSITVLVQNK